MLSGGWSSCVLGNITTYLLSLEAGHTLRAEGEDERVTKGKVADTMKPWIKQIRKTAKTQP